MFQYLADIEEHLNVTIQQVDPEINVPVNDFDGKVTYGEKKLNAGKCHNFFLSSVIPFNFIWTLLLCTAICNRF